METSVANKFSVIIRCKNEERWVGHTIQSAFDFLGKPEIIVVDNHSTDSSRLVIRNFMSFEDVKIIDVDEYTPGKALNLGVREARYPNILLLSGHCVLKKFKVDQILTELNTHKAVFGKQIPIYHGKRIIPRYLWANFHDSPKVNYYSEAEKRHFLHNGMCVYKKETLLERPFNERISGKEDRYWVKDIVEAGHTFYYAPHLMVADHHWTPDGNTWKGIG